MAKLKRSVITNKGFEALRKSIARSKKVNFTRLVASDTVYNDSTDIATLTNINGVKQSISISEVKEIENNKIKVTGVFKNTGLNTGYAMNTIALYGNVEGETEILFSVTRAEVADYMPATNGINVSTITIEIVLVLSESANISVTLDTSALVTTGMLESYVKKSWGFLGQPADNLNVVLTDKTNVLGSQVYRAYTPRGEFKGELKFNNNNMYFNFENKVREEEKTFRKVILENDLATADVAGVITENRVKELVPYGTVDETSLEGSKMKELMGCEYGGLLNVEGVKRVGVAYYDTVNKQIVVPKVENNLTYYDALKFLPISDYQTANRLENLFEIKSFTINSHQTILNFYLRNNIVYCYLRTNSNSAFNAITELTKIGQIPKDFIPKEQVTFIGEADTSPSKYEVQIKNSGDIFIKRSRGLYSFGSICYIV